MNKVTAESQKRRIPDANQWNYTNLLKQNKDIRCQYMDLYQSPKTKPDTGCQYMDLHQSPQNDHRKTNAKEWTYN